MGGAQQWDGFVHLFSVHNDSEAELLHLSGPFCGLEPWELLGLVNHRS